MSIIQGIELYDVVGLPSLAENILFIPALFDFEVQGKLECRLSEHLQDMDTVKKILAAFDSEMGKDLSYWVRARIPTIFGISPPKGLDDCRYKVLDTPFLAVIQTVENPYFSAIPFVCSEGYSGPGLIFSTTENNPLLKNRLAYAFWSILLRNPSELASFEQLLITDDGWSTVGYDQNRFFFNEIYDPDEPEEGLHPQLVPFLGERTPCLDCDGSGEESFCPAGEICETCKGLGWLP